MQDNHKNLLEEVQQENQVLKRKLKRMQASLAQSDKMAKSKEAVNRNLYVELEVLSKDLTREKKQLEEANLQLLQTMQERSEALAKVAILEERNRIAREIHDIVGHTLTLTIVQMEVGIKLLEKNPLLAKEKLELSQELVRKGLNEIRKSVRKMKESELSQDFVPSLIQLIKEAETFSGVSVDINIEEHLPPLRSSQKNVLYHALQEGLTNGIRHGKSTTFSFRLAYEGEHIHFSLMDNGVGFSETKLGFGLSTLNERVGLLGGSFHLFSNSGEGCRMILSIPCHREAGGATK